MAGSPFWRAPSPLPGGLAASSDGAAASFEIRRGGGRGRVPVDAPLHPQAQMAVLGAARTPFLVHRVQRVLQPFCGCGGALPLILLWVLHGGAAHEKRRGPFVLVALNLLNKCTSSSPVRPWCSWPSASPPRRRPGGIKLGGHHRRAGLRESGGRGRAILWPSPPCSVCRTTPGFSFSDGFGAVYGNAVAVRRHSLQLLLPAGPPHAGDLRFRRH